MEVMVPDTAGRAEIKARGRIVEVRWIPAVEWHGEPCRLAILQLRR